MALKPLFKKPYGGSEYLYNNRHMGTSSALCEVCGTQHDVGEESLESLTIDRFLGRQMVEQCCGGVLDLLYDESGEEFAIRFLKEFGQDPLDPRFLMFKTILEDVLAHIEKNAGKLQDDIRKNQTALASLGKKEH